MVSWDRRFTTTRWRYVLEVLDKSQGATGTALVKRARTWLVVNVSSSTTPQTAMSGSQSLSLTVWSVRQAGNLKVFESLLMSWKR